MKTTCLLMFAIVLFGCKHNTKELPITASNDIAIHKVETDAMEKETIYQFKVNDLYGNPFDFSSLKGKKIMVVNTASKCGLTPQYEQLEEIYKTYKDNNFIIVGFPANNFKSQEPGTNAEIAEFCTANYGVTFPMMSKISVKGNDMDAVYKFLTQKDKNGLENSEVEWNFQKYLIDENGYVVRVVSPKTLPKDDSIISWIKS
ncbi:glutathione peroxidase [Formosa sp. PL04]|uniref:glutathione peroxidase n=1 Tax=Formosa sp. PL04 TaxID=3081755 RepID=UPI00298161D7|nr:glutathione peroxidase [Formosa sp. PL04]MDW5288454.1 glutathione peroxidase [Formosa sp. PL04]